MSREHDPSAEPSAERTLVLVRHGESIWNAERRWQGHADVPLSARGEEEARAVGARLADARFDLVATSDLSRARQTAERIARAHEAAGHAAPLLLDPALREIDVGAMTGVSHAEAAVRFEAHLRALAHGDDLPVGDTGESLPGFEARIERALEALARAHPEARRILIVTHGGSIRAAVRRVLRLPTRHRSLEASRNTAITELTIEGGRLGRLVTFNDATHLPVVAKDLAGAGHEAHETIVGAGASERVAALLGLGDGERLVAPGPEAVTVIDAEARKLVRYGARLSPIDAPSRSAP